ncbi:MAG: glycosyltransferase family 1 protein [bacterium]|nr:glycosyltransferase family 1 protein [bacterium]
MKIGIDASRYTHAQATGVEWYSWHIINSLLKVIPENDEVNLYSREVIVLPDSILPNKCHNVVLPAKRLWTLRSLSREMKSSPPSVLFVPSHTLPLKLPKRSVITVHDVAFRHLKKSYSFFQYHYLNWSTKYACKHATKIIVPSCATADDLRNFFNCPSDKIEVIAHGFDPPRPVDERVFENSEVLKYFEIDERTKYILFVGRLESKKNLVRLVEAFSVFSKTHDDFKLILAGKRGLGFNKILKTVNRLELMHKVIMPGYITETEKSALYKYCKFFAFPSLYEGFGLPLLEAFHYGKPVLSSNVSSMPEVAGEGALFVDPYDVSAIADALSTLATDDDFVQELVKKGKERLKDFTWEKAAKETLKVING